MRSCVHMDNFFRGCGLEHCRTAEVLSPVSHSNECLLSQTVGFLFHNIVRCHFEQGSPSTSLPLCFAQTKHVKPCGRSFGSLCHFPEMGSTLVDFSGVITLLFFFFFYNFLLSLLTFFTQISSLSTSYIFKPDLLL